MRVVGKKKVHCYNLYKTKMVYAKFLQQQKRKLSQKGREWCRDNELFTHWFLSASVSVSLKVYWRLEMGHAFFTVQVAKR